MALFKCKMQNAELYEKGGANVKKDNRYATNEGGIIKAPRKPQNQPKATVTKGNDLRDGKKGK